MKFTLMTLIMIYNFQKFSNAFENKISFINLKK
jgi:hypothetical protein